MTIDDVTTVGIPRPPTDATAPQNGTATPDVTAANRGTADPTAAPAAPADGATTMSAPDTHSPSWRNVAVGAAAVTGEAVAALLATTRSRAIRPVQRGAEQTGQFLDATRKATVQRVTELADRGAVEGARGRQRAGSLVDAVVTAVATSHVVNLAVDAQVDRLLRPLVVAVLDDVFQLLEAEPDRVQAMIKGQRESMVDELVTRIRASAAVGDAVVDRWTTRAFRRRPRPAPAELSGPDLTGASPPRP
jgi:hypothetical protein